MSIWISGSLPEVISATHSGLVNAIYADAATLARWVREGQSVRTVLRALAEAAPYSVFVQLRGPEKAVFEAEAQALQGFSELAQPCLPPTAEGLAAAVALVAAEQEVTVMGVTTLGQAFLCAQAEVAAITVPVGLMQARGEDPWSLLQQCRALFDHLGVGCFLMATDLADATAAGKALSSGVDGLILTPDRLQQLSDSPLSRGLTQAAEAAFAEIGRGQAEGWWQ